MIEEKIAVDGFKDVLRGTYAEEPVTISSIRGNERDVRLLARDFCSMRMLSRHPGVPKFYGHCSTSMMSKNDQIVLVSELCEHGDLMKFVASPEFDTMVTRDRMMLCVDILRVLDVMHDEGMYHRRRFLMCHN